ncbi:hypothetical protein BDN72DRAFT_962548 [Pluteus cervinus]|uniref:Uncharacterized protein n=1 Tax=Pluteus cervinus TaxID=181527 RepID=A0ACD3AIK1_9AGAR|nr:hypothetical protein BDN72DRAFT_962548 [Pluteus cervinus]
MPRIGAAGTLRHHIGLAMEEEPWENIRDSITEIMKDHLDVSPGAPTAARQGDQLLKVMEQIYHKHKTYFPNYSRLDDEHYLKRYLRDRFNDIRKGLQRKESRWLEKESRNRADDRSSRPAGKSNANVENRNLTPTVVTVRPYRNGNQSPRPQQLAPYPPIQVPHNADQTRTESDELLIFLTNCKLPLPQLHPYLKNHGHNMNSVMAMSEWDIDLIQKSFQQLASLAVTSKDSNTVESGSSRGSPDTQDGGVTLAHWDLLAGYIYRLGHSYSCY